MNFNQLKSQFLSTISNLYSIQEAEEIFFLFLEENNKFKRLDFIINRVLAVENHKLWVEQMHRLKKGEPAQYVLGSADFFGMKIKVDSSVLIPRPETEELVDLILKSGTPAGEARILDIGTGSGCIAIALKKAWPYALVTAVDISNAAIKTATTNAIVQNVNIECLVEDIGTYQTDKKFEVIVSNPPYIPTGDKKEMASHVLDYEPHLALFAPENDPLYFYKQILIFADKHIKKPDGKLYFEAHHRYAKDFVDFCKKDFKVELKNDMFGKPRFIVLEF